MAKDFFALRLSDKTIGALGKIAAEKGVTVSALARELLEAAADGESLKAVGNEIDLLEKIRNLKLESRRQKAQAVHFCRELSKTLNPEYLKTVSIKAYQLSERYRFALAPGQESIPPYWIDERQGEGGQIISSDGGITNEGEDNAE
jgi:hypothetical protein